MNRPETLADGGMVATAHSLATAAGVRVLHDGGNAIDAVLTAANVLGVVLPSTSGIGGDTFALVYDAAERRVFAINGSGPAPAALTPAALAERGHAAVPLRGMLAPTVPGAVDVMTTMLERWGSGRFDLPAILAPAIHYAEHGAPLGRALGESWVGLEPLLRRYPSTAKTFLHNDAVYRPGTMLRLPDYARSLRALAAGGRDAFYHGELCDAIVAYSSAHGGLFTREDFAHYACEIVAPLQVNYRGRTVFSNPPPSQGFLLLEELAIAAGFDLTNPHDAATIHTLAEAKKLAFADRNAYFGDPSFVDNPTATMLDPAYVATRRAALDPQRAQSAPVPGAVPEVDGDTTYLCAADRDGNMVSFITSISAVFGCGDVIAGTGILLNNRGGRGFRAEPGHPNTFGPGRRSMHTLHAAFFTAPDGTRCAFGSPGGDGQPQTNLQVLTNLVDFGLDPQAAVALPRWESFPGTDPEYLGEPFHLAVEPGFPHEALHELRARGHRILEVPLHNSSAQAIVRSPDGVYAGGSDPRSDGSAVGI